MVWLTPIYPSPDADHGYDVADYRNVRDDYGGLVALERLLDDAHACGLRVVMDIVPNHTSDQHSWFVDARHGRRKDRAHTGHPCRCRHRGRPTRRDSAVTVNMWIDGEPMGVMEPETQTSGRLGCSDQPDYPVVAGPVSADPKPG